LRQQVCPTSKRRTPHDQIAVRTDPRHMNVQARHVQDKNDRGTTVIVFPRARRKTHLSPKLGEREEED
jgi:hypothetical protein